MKTALASIACRRPEIHALTLQSINRCRNIDKVQRICFFDGEGYDLPELKDFEVRRRNERFGIEKHILSTIKELFEKDGFDRVIICEDDIYVSADFIDFLFAAYEFKNEHVFSVSAYHPSRTFSPFTKQEYHEDEITIVDGFTPWGVMYDKEDYSLFKYIICDDYFDNQVEFFKRFVFPMAPYFKNASHLQDGMIDTLRFAHQYKHIAPFFSRAQNIGYYGEHQLNAYKQEDMMLPDMIAQSELATETFHDDYQWTSLKLVKFVGEW